MGEHHLRIGGDGGAELVGRLVPGLRLHGLDSGPVVPLGVSSLVDLHGLGLGGQTQQHRQHARLAS